MILLIYCCPHLYGSALGAQVQMLEALGRKVEDVYRCCVGNKMGNLTTIQMMTVIESQLLQHLENMERIPRDILDQLQKMKNQDRWMRWVA